MLRKVVFYTRVWVTILAPVVLLFLPADFFDKGESICLSKSLAGIECYACGMTRAVMHFIHFEFEAAWEFNKLSYIVVPLLFPLWLKAVFEAQGKQLPGILGKLT
ncbi:DUF2752 domain-containing protein [Flavobacterium salilacus subsp. salilacus]|uniref:DUF2752 domain-containing protein n=1 Tax=Flavobacterium TaxID=237 RepID=UPI001074FF8C|nr:MULTISPECIES: DUF2752 domain-containing protein [Flavobacterium]KAF2519893.1 DUF2752 domain-containing protein [Flavobacterium salilacus subsp. salilacus]MBE1614201.1 DUF2752 domain-containing protein [Flavobacterium sp. SaA2.13]